MVKLLDFGLVGAINAGDGGGRLTQEGAIAGTPEYMSPEQAEGGADLDGRSDIYSLGAVAYFLLTARPPFADRSPMQMLATHIYEAPAALRDVREEVPEDLQGVVLRCLEKEPGKRYQDVEALEAGLVECETSAAWSEAGAREWWRERGAGSEA